MLKKIKSKMFSCKDL